MVRDTYRISSAPYDQILTRGELRNSERKVKASVILISRCQENQLPADGESNGLFTSQLLHTWNDGLFKGNYKEFRNKIVETMPPDQKHQIILPLDLETSSLKSKSHLQSNPNPSAE
jgi:metacaspase-1